MGNNRGGVAILVRNKLANDITGVDLTTEDQVWFSFKKLPGVIFAGLYVTPSDSIYHTEASFAAIQARCLSSQDKQFILFGDLNARCGAEVKQLLDNADSAYHPTDLIVNPRGRKLIQLCRDAKLLIANNLSYKIGGAQVTLQGNLTFRRRIEWISEIDTCIVSKSLMQNIKALHVDQRYDFPSDHAPLTVEFEIPS